MRRIAIQIMSTVGTNLILRQEMEIEKTVPIGVFAKTIIPLERYNGEDTLDLALFRGTAAVIKFNSCNSRDVIGFFSKRIPCSCLERKYKHAKKTMPKVSTCEGCKSVKERKSLMVCSRCRIVHYCCRECQVVDWPNHAVDCHFLVAQSNRMSGGGT